jgi:catechol 1,2-dioxygenase
MLTILRQVMADGRKPITTQIFDKASKYLDDDSVFAVKDSLVVEFVQLKDNPKSSLQLEYDVLMAPFDGHSAQEDGATRSVSML